MKHFVPLLIAFAALAACDSSGNAPSSSVDGKLSSVAEARAKYADPSQTFDAQLAAVSRKHPGLKGVVSTGDERAYQVIVGEGAPSAVPGGAASEALRRDLAEAFGANVSQVHVEGAPAMSMAQGGQGAERPDFHVLYEVKMGLRRFLFESDRVNMLDLDEILGYVVVGVESSADERWVREQMIAQEVSLVKFIRSKPAVSFVKQELMGFESTVSVFTSSRRLRADSFRPLMSGPQIDWFNPRTVSRSFCTLGPVVQSGSSYGFLTAAHCTDDRNRIDNVTFSNGQQRVGIEALEPSYRSGWFITDGYLSDVAFVRADPGIQLRGQMTSADNCQGGACTENGIFSDLTGDAPYLAVRTRVFKTGRTTGTTAGLISRTCVDKSYGGRERLLCQSLVDMDPTIPTNGPQIAFHGDSGAAVLASGGVPGSTGAGISGVLWGGEPPPGASAADGTNFYFSPWENISQTYTSGAQYKLPVVIVQSTAGIVLNQVSSVNPDPEPDPNPDCGYMVAC